MTVRMTGMNRTIPRNLLLAQRRYMALTGVQISQTEVQRLSAALHGGASIPDAVATVYEFFARPIDWQAERQAFAEWLAKRAVGVIAAGVVIRCLSA